MNKNPFKGKSIFDIVDKDEEKEEVAPKRDNPFKGRSIRDIDDIELDNKEDINESVDEEVEEEIIENEIEEDTNIEQEEPEVEDIEKETEEATFDDDTYIATDSEIEELLGEESSDEEDFSEDDDIEEEETSDSASLEEDEAIEDDSSITKEEVNPFKGRSIYSLGGVVDEPQIEPLDDEEPDETEDDGTLEEDTDFASSSEEASETIETVEESNQEEVVEEANINFVLITGAYGGLGRVAMEECLKQNLAVFALDVEIDEDYIDDNVMPIQCDVSNERSIYQAYNTISEYTDKLKAIINCAGVFYFDTMVEGSEEKLRKIIDINFYGTYRINQIFLPFLEKGGKIINVTSEVANYSPQPFMGCYSISKKMVDCYSDVLRRELNYVGIKVIKIQAGSFRTGLFDKVNTEFEKMYNNTTVYKKQLKKLKYMMDRELHKQHNPLIFGKVIKKILKKKRPKICYKVCRSKSLKSLNRLPEKWQDRIYKRVIK